MTNSSVVLERRRGGQRHRRLSMPARPSRHFAFSDPFAASARVETAVRGGEGDDLLLYRSGLGAPTGSRDGWVFRGPLQFKLTRDANLQRCLRRAMCSIRTAEKHDSYTSATLRDTLVLYDELAFCSDIESKKSELSPGAQVRGRVGRVRQALHLKLLLAVESERGSRGVPLVRNCSSSTALPRQVVV